jgi:hypothetical protein
MIDFFNPLSYPVGLPSLSYDRVLIIPLSLVLLSGFSTFMFTNIDQPYVQASSDCDRQTFSLVDCPGSSSGDEETSNDGENIEQQIPSVIPFP